MAKAMLIDTSKCMGCRGCQVACKQWNELAAVRTKSNGSYENPAVLSASTWTRVEFRERYEQWLFRKHQCMHCTEASCVAVCPTGAAYHQGEFVLIDQGQCIGCGYCVEACPFTAVHRDEPRGTAQKCTLCIDRVTNGLTPACAKTCPSRAVQFGERTDLIIAAQRRVQNLIALGNIRARLYGETELGGLGVMYVLTEPPSAFGLPESPRLATMNVLAYWVGGIITAAIIGYAPFALLFTRRKPPEEGQDTQSSRNADKGGS